jgi:hypothetical protein
MMADQRSLSDWMSDEEYRLRQALEPVSLVVEANLTYPAAGIRPGSSPRGPAPFCVNNRANDPNDCSGSANSPLSTR